MVDESESQKNETGGRDKSGLAALAKYSHLGLVLPASVFCGWIVGALLDKAFHTSWIYLAGMIFGALAGFWELVRSAMKLGSEK